MHRTPTTSSGDRKNVSRSTIPSTVKTTITVPKPQANSGGSSVTSSNNGRTVTTQSYTASSYQTTQQYSVYAEPDSPIASMRQKIRTQDNQTPRTNRTPIHSAMRKPGTPALSIHMNTGNDSNCPATPFTFPNTPSHLFSPRFADRNSKRNPSGCIVSSSEDCTITRQPVKCSPSSHFADVVHAYSPPFLQPINRVMQGSHHRSMAELDNVDLDAFYLVKTLPKLSTINAIRKSPIPCRTKGTPRIMLALDLDETLVHCSISPIPDPDFTFHVSFGGQNYEVYTKVRPHLQYFLASVSQWFELAIFTASQKVYADTILDLLDPMNTYFTHRLFRDSCVFVEGNFLKDLRVLGRPMSEVVLVDNSIQAFGFQLDNGIPCESWYDDPNDVELLNLVPYLKHLRDVADVRPYIKNTFKLKEFIKALPQMHY